jgi:hypothetical protein
MKKLYSITVRGKRDEWDFNFWSDDYWDDWEKDGLKVCRVLHTYPDWIVDFHLTKIWDKLQDWYIIPLE